MRGFMAFVLLAVSFTASAQELIAAAPILHRAENLRTTVDQEMLQKQYDALLGMVLAKLEYSPRGPVKEVQGDTGIVLPYDTNDRRANDTVSDFLPLFKDILLANGSESLKVKRNWVVYGNERGILFTQSIGGIPVINSAISIAYNGNTKRVSSISAHFVPDRNLPRSPKLTAKEAEDVVRKAIANASQAKPHLRGNAFLAYYAEFGDPSPPQLVWAMDVVLPASEDTYYVNAITGQIAGKDKLMYSVTRKVYDVNGSTLPYFPSDLPPALSYNDIIAQTYRWEGYDYTEQVDSLLRARVPALLGEFPSKVHIITRYAYPGLSFGQPIGNDYYLRFGGDNSTYHHGTHARDVVAHEYGHGLGLRTFAASGNAADQQHHALQESFADIMATVVDVGANGSPNLLTWIIGDQLYKSDDFKGFRSLKMPRSDPSSVYSTADWYDDRQLGPAPDEHYNSTIVSHAYYLLVNGGKHARWADPGIPDTDISAQGESKTRAIFVGAFNNPSMNTAPDFVKLKSAAMAYALANYDSATRTQVKNAFEAVGICGVATVAPAKPTLQDIGDLLCAGRFNPTWNLIPGATRYYAEVSPAQFGFALATPVTNVDGQTNQCLFQVSQPSLFRMMACNDCGCGPWSDTEYLEYWSPCL